MPRNSSLSPKGFLICEGNVVAETSQCCHCGGHFVIEPGSGKVRGYCARCGDVTCGLQRCDGCVPNEAWLENVEAGRRGDFRRIFSALPINPIAGLSDGD